MLDLIHDDYAAVDEASRRASRRLVVASSATPRNRYYVKVFLLPNAGDPLNPQYVIVVKTGPKFLTEVDEDCCSLVLVATAVAVAAAASIDSVRVDLVHAEQESGELGSVERDSEVRCLEEDELVEQPPQ